MPLEFDVQKNITYTRVIIYSIHINTLTVHCLCILEYCYVLLVDHVISPLYIHAHTPTHSLSPLYRAPYCYAYMQTHVHTNIQSSLLQFNKHFICRIDVCIVLCEICEYFSYCIFKFLLEWVFWVYTFNTTIRLRNGIGIMYLPTYNITSHTHRGYTNKIRNF